MSNNRILNILSAVGIAGIIGFGYWDNYVNFQKTNTGISYKYVQHGDKNSACKEDQFIYLERSISYKDKVIVEANDNPYYPLLPSYSDLKKFDFDGGQYEAMNFLKKKGDCCLFKIKASKILDKNDIAYFNQKFNTDIKEDSDVVLKVKIKDFVDRDQISSVFKSYQMEKNETRRKELKIQMDKDIVLIENFLKEKGLQAKSTESGLHYIVKAEGEGETPKDGDTVLIDYTGKTLDGKVFDSSIQSVAKDANIYNERRTYEPIKCVIGRDRFIEGFAEGILLSNKNSETVLYIPSNLAYGPQGIPGVIAPSACLIFDIKIIDIIKG